MVPIAGGGGLGLAAVAGVVYLFIIAWVGRAEKFIFLRLDGGRRSDQRGARGMGEDDHTPLVRPCLHIAT